MMLSFTKLLSTRTSLINSVSLRVQLDQVAGLKTIEERIGIPPKPKRPLAPFMRFYQKIRPNLRQEHPSEKIGGLARLAASQWKAVDTDTKEKYVNEFRKDQETFLKDIARYQNGLSDEQREQVKQMKLLVSEKKKIREKRRDARKLGKPKQPVPPFMQFLQEETVKAGGSRSGKVKEFVISAGQKWRQLSSQDKETYLKRFREAREGYKIEIEKWEEKMIKSGNSEMVRRKSLIETKSAGETKPRRTGVERVEEIASPHPKFKVPDEETPKPAAKKMFKFF